MKDIKVKKRYCNKCNNEISYNMNDILGKSDILDNNIHLVNYINCPNCNNEIILDKLSLIGNLYSLERSNKQFNNNDHTKNNTKN